MVYHPHTAPIIRSALHGVVLGLVVVLAIVAPVALPSCKTERASGARIDGGAE